MARGVGGHSPSNLAYYLSGIDFPCRKDDLIQHAKNNGAEAEVLQMLQELPEKEYGTMADVMRGYGEARDEEEDGGKRTGAKTRHEDARK
jgi:Protein of unknown function (DUF2795)